MSAAMPLSSLLPPPPPLPLLRHAIDAVDDGLLVLLAGRRRLVAQVAARKHEHGRPLRDARRERQVHARAQAWARWLRLPAASAQALMDLLIADACALQQARHVSPPASLPALPMSASSATPSDTTRSDTLSSLWPALLPPPRYWRQLLRLVPPALQASALQAALDRALAPALRQGAPSQSMFDAVQSRRLGIAVEDLGLHWVCELSQGHVRLLQGQQAEATVAGSATDLLLLASRQQDADTLFFQRRLRLTGDVELGLTLRNLLDRLPWESLPLGSRIVLQRAALLADSARGAYRQRHR